MQIQIAAVAAIQFALETDDGLAFLRCWNEGEFDAIRREWPEAPDAVFVGADPLHPSTCFARLREVYSGEDAEALVAGRNIKACR